MEDEPDLYAAMSAAERATVSFEMIFAASLTDEERKAALRLYREMDEIMDGMPFVTLDEAAEISPEAWAKLSRPTA